jgi:3-oxoacyl-[acyl-carrier-protein] synthase II
MRRVVITGLGLVTPLGADVETVWANLLAGKSGAGPITRFDASNQKCQIACEVKPADHEYGFDPNKRVDHKVQRQVDPFIIYGIDAAGQAIEDAGLTDMDEETRMRAGCSIGSGIGGLPGIESESIVLHEKGPSRVSPHFVHGRLINLISGQVSIKYGLMGPNHAVVTACSTGAHSIGDAARMIRDDDADIMLAGGAEGTINPLGVAGFAQARALNCSYNDRPTEASRPYDKDRDGFVMGEGAGVLVLEEYEHAKARGAKIYAEVVGYGLSGDAYHVTAPHPEGKGAELAMRMALKKAGMAPGDIDYVNAHGTSTMADTIELAAVKRVLGPDLSGASMSSTKSAIGHLLGGAGAVEAIFCILAMRDQIVPPTLNLHNPDEGTDGVDLVPLTARKREVRAVLNNSFGFGGTNASLVMKKI